MEKVLNLNLSQLEDTVCVDNPLKEKERMNDWMKCSLENEEEVENEEAGAAEKDMEEEQRPCYSQHIWAHRQDQAHILVPMVISPRPAQW